MSDQPISVYDQMTIDMIQSLIARANNVLARDLAYRQTHPAVQRALAVLGNDAGLKELLHKSRDAATVAIFNDVSTDVETDLRETS